MPHTTGQQPSRRPTLRDVAKQAGVSAQTASNVLNGRFDMMGESTRARVEEAMNRLGYHPNLIARGLRVSRTRTFGFLVVDEAPGFLADPLTDLLVAGVGDAARDSGYSVLIQAERPLAEERTLLRPLLEGRVDAAFVLMSGDPQLRANYLVELAGLGIPFVVFDEVVEDQRILSVRTKERDSSRRLTEHLIGQGRRRIAFIAARLPWAVVEQRYLGYRDALRRAKISRHRELELFEATWQAYGGQQMAGKLLGLPSPPDAIMCGSDVLAVGAIRAIKEAGLRVPDDIAVTGFDDFEFSEFVDPPLTTVHIPGYEMGQIAARMLVDRLEGSPVIPPHVVLDNELRIRASG